MCSQFRSIDTYSIFLAFFNALLLKSSSKLGSSDPMILPEMAMILFKAALSLMVSPPNHAHIENVSIDSIDAFSSEIKIS